MVLEALWLKTRRRLFRETFDFLLKLFAISFSMGVVSGLVMSYQFGTNWSAFSAATGNILGSLMTYEVMAAFFLEASFLGVMLFGRKRVGEGVYLFATVAVAVGTLMSAFWILSANSWMHTPAGYELQGGVFVATDWWSVVFNPSFPVRFTHMVLACYICTAAVVAGIGAYHLIKDTHKDHARAMLAMALPFIAITTLLQIVVGHEHGVVVHEHQPTKLAAIEGHWQSYDDNAPLILFALPDADAAFNRAELAVPSLGSLVVTGSFDGGMRGLTAWPEEDRPPVAIVFWSFRIMVGAGVVLLTLGIFGTWHLLRGTLELHRCFLRTVVFTTPLAFIALLAGWVTAEVGRQPWVVQGLMRTAEGISPVTGDSVGLSLIVYTTVYLAVFGAGFAYLLSTARQGPKEIAG